MLVRSFPRWLALTVILGVMAFFIADERALVGLVAVMLVVAARALTRDEHHAVLPQWLLNIAVLVAAAWTALTAVEQPEKFVEALATLCAWVQVVKFYEKPTPRNQAQLIILSVFIVIAALLTSNSLPVGLMVFLYIPVALWTTFLHQIHAGLHAVDAPRQSPAAPSPEGAPRRLRRLTAGASIFMGLFGATIYLSIPRGMGSDLINDWSSPAVGATIGFRDEIVLGRSGELEDNATTVLDLTLIDESGRNIGDDERPVLLRGAVLDEYDPGARRWRRSIGGLNPTIPRVGVGQAFTRLGPRTNGPVNEQRITMRNKSNEFLFASFRPFEISFDRETDVQRDETDVVLTSSRRSGRVSYTVRSQNDYSAPPGFAEAGRRLPPLFREGRIRELTDQIVAGAGFARSPDDWHHPDDRLIANVLERWLRSNNTYTTTMTAAESEEDPIEMFLFRTREGHCEYFASAMAAMCRSIGVDARVVVGYRAVEFNEIAGHYVVRQSHAHSWVEVLVAPGKWETFDPSPPDGVAMVASSPTGLIGRVRQLYDAIDHAWVTWVVGFDESTRVRLFGVPMGNQYRFMDNLGRLLSMDRGVLVRRLVRSFAVGVFTFAAVAGAGFALRAAYGAWRRGAGRRSVVRSTDEPDPEILAQISFYKRCLVRLRRLGLAKPLWRPPLAHAGSIAGQSASAADALRVLAGLYYAARFGRRILTPEELARAEEALVALESLRSADLRAGAGA